MPYAPLDEHFDEAPSNGDLELEHLGAYACSISYCTRNLTDGVFPKRALRTFGKSGCSDEVYRDMLRLGKWAEREDGKVVVVTFKRWNPTRREVLRKKKAAAEKVARWRAEKKLLKQSISPSKEAQAVTGNVTGNVPIQDTALHSTALQGTDLLGARDFRLQVANLEQKKSRPRSRGSAVPAQGADVAGWARERSIPTEHPEFERFVDHHRANGVLRVDWTAAWRNWLRRAPEFARPPISRTRPAVQPIPAKRSWAAGGDAEP